MDLPSWPFGVAPKTDSAPDQRVTDILNAILLVIGLGCLIALVLVPLLTPERNSRLVYVVVVLLAALLTRGLARRGHLRAASRLLLLTVWLVVLFSSLTGGGLRSATLTGGNMVTIAAGGLLLGWEGAATFAVLGAATGWLLMVNEATPFIALPAIRVTAAALWIGSTVFYLMIALLFSVAIRRLNQALTQAEQKETALRESEARFRAFMDTSPAMVIMKDLHGRYVYCNALFEKLNGFEARDVLGKTEFDFFPREEAEQFTADDQAVLRSGQPLVMEYAARTPTGDLRDWWVFKFPLTSSAGQRYVGVQVLDITERKQMEREREGLIRDLETRNAELERFTYTVSHDLKSPLVTMRGFLGFLERDIQAGNSERIQADLRRIGEATDKMQKLLTELLELSRIGRIMDQPQEVPLAMLVNEALSLVAGQLQRHAVQVEVAPGLPAVKGDRTRLVEVLQNLLENAVKFMGDQPNPRIEVGARTTGPGSHVFFVRDNGVGIAPRFHERIFALFEKLNPRMEGTGIGLALVKRIIEVHGGRIWVESQGNGQGSTFWFTLPVTDQGDSDERAKSYPSTLPQGVCG